ncbi:manganese and iron superoxide dismutase [Hypoxylon sp. FL1284]|nr:manganese and iron superoxide dismutase [Hypoxylon sp. FL1284]
MLRPRLRILGASRLWRPAISARSLHNVPGLYQFKTSEGVPGLLSPAGFAMSWTQYMQFVIEKLNALTADTEFATLEPLQIIKATAREPHHAPIFNYASMAHNNAFFFQGLANLNTEQQRPPTEEAGENDEDRIPSGLKWVLEQQFSSVETLRREFLSTAMGMFGPGFVWLVKNAQTSDMRIVATYLAGTPYTAGHWRRQGVDMNSQGAATSVDTVRGFLTRMQTGAGADTGGGFAPQNQLAPGGTDVVPLLCLNTWEHVWLRDYGIGNGKRAFVQDWWRVVDWNKVEGLAKIERPQLK